MSRAASETGIVVLDASELAPRVPGLRALEAKLRYPIADGADHFRIDHGPSYHGFFSGLGRARFVLALGDEPRASPSVLGSLALVDRDAGRGSRRLRTLYLGDYKIAPEHRGRGIGQRLSRAAAWDFLRRGGLLSHDLVYAAAMRGAKGDVTRSSRGADWMLALRKLARLVLYFEAPARLAALPPGGPAPPRGLGIDLSPGVRDEPLATTGTKDFVLESTGRPWPLVHLPASPLAWLPRPGEWLARHGKALLARGGEAVACFGLDERLHRHTSWLAGQGIRPGATCTIYAAGAWGWFRRPPWVHLATSEI